MEIEVLFSSSFQNPCLTLWRAVLQSLLPTPEALEETGYLVRQCCFSCSLTPPASELVGVFVRCRLLGPTYWLYYWEEGLVISILNKWSLYIYIYIYTYIYVCTHTHFRLGGTVYGHLSFPWVSLALSCMLLIIKCHHVLNWHPWRGFGEDWISTLLFPLFHRIKGKCIWGYVQTP